MTRKDFATIAVRILALYSLIESVPFLGHVVYYGLPSLVDFLRGYGVSSLHFVFFSETASFTLFIPVWAILWFKADAIAGRIVRKCHVEPEPAPSAAKAFDRQGTMIVGSSLLGLYLLVRSITAIVSEIGWLLRYIPPHTGPQRSPVIMVSYLIQLVLSLWLILGAKGIVALISRLRTVGIKQ